MRDCGACPSAGRCAASPAGNGGELLERYARDFSALAAPGQWQDLLQALRDAARQGTPVNHDFLLIRGDGSERWVNLRSQILSARGGTVSFFSVLLDVDEAYRDRERLRRAEAALAGAREELQSLLDHLPGGYCLLRQEGDALTLLHLSRGLAELLHDFGLDADGIVSAAMEMMDKDMK
mgnify:CR=1 FL=1